MRMARKKAEKDAKKAKKARKDEGSGLMDKLSLIVTLLVVSVFAVFTGYLVGQYAIYWVASPIVGEARQEPSGTQAVESSAPSTQAAASVASNPSQAQPAQTQTPQPTQPQPSQSTTPQPAATSTAPPTQSPPSPSQQPTVYRVQVGRYSTQSAANAKLQDLKASVPDAWVVYDAPSGEYRVQAGAFSSRARADEFAGELAALGHDAFVVR